MFKLVEKFCSSSLLSGHQRTTIQCLKAFSKDNKQKPDKELPENATLPSKVETAPPKSVEPAKSEPKSISETDLPWKTPWHEKEGEVYTSLRVFNDGKSKRNVLQMLEGPISLQTFKNWLSKEKEKDEVTLQSYIPERHNILGNELAAAHFIVYRGGAVKFFNRSGWIKADENKNYSLPTKYMSNEILQGIDCCYMNLRYEGLENLSGLRQVEWLSFNGCKHIDDWCLDKIANIFSHSLIYLDLRDCPNITERGLGALYKMPKLKILLLDDLWKDTIFEMTCLLLQEVNPSLDIRSK